MARIIVLGAGISGHTAASYLQKWLGKKHEVIVVTPNSQWNWIPSNVWVGVSQMTPEQVTFPLEPIYKRAGITYVQALAKEIHPEGGGDQPTPHVVVEHTGSGREGERERITYDFLINATGPKLNFGKTPGLGPQGHTESVCTVPHALSAAAQIDAAIERMRKGERQRFLVGTGHGQATCQGAAFEFTFNLEHRLRAKGVRDRATVTYITNEYRLGDFGMSGLFLKRGGYVTNSSVFTESLFVERGVRWITGTHIRQVEPDRVDYETLNGEERSEPFDFAMLIPPFSGVGLTAFDRRGQEITDKLFNAGGFMKVDACYDAKPYAEWRSSDWPETYRSPHYHNIFAVGIAFAPPHAISKPMHSPGGTPIFPTPPRTGMPSATIGHTVAHSIAAMLQKGLSEPPYGASMAKMGAACVASAGTGLLGGTAASITVFPVVPDFQRYPVYGRDLRYTFGEIGLAGHWIKLLLHYAFIYKAKLQPFWYAIPE
jgi:sulfide:quinone oxidoreductase